MGSAESPKMRECVGGEGLIPRVNGFCELFKQLRGYVKRLSLDIISSKYEILQFRVYI